MIGTSRKARVAAAALAVVLVVGAAAPASDATDSRATGGDLSLSSAQHPAAGTGAALESAGGAASPARTAAEVGHRQADERP